MTADAATCQSPTAPIAIVHESCDFVSMPSSHDQERALVWMSAAAALATVCAIFVASIWHANLLDPVTSGGVFLPMLGVILLSHIGVGVISFFRRERPTQTRTVRTFFHRDKWLHDCLKVSQPRSVVALGYSLVFLNLAMFGAIILSALCMFFRLMSLEQVVSVFVVGTLLLISVKAIAGGILIVRQLQMDRRERPF